MKTKHNATRPATALLICAVGLLLSVVMVSRAWHSFADRDQDNLPLISAR